MATGPGLRAAEGFSAAEPGGGLKTRAARGGPGGGGGGARRRVVGAWWCGGRRSRAPLPPPTPRSLPAAVAALAPPRAAGPERGSRSPLLSPRSGVGRETPRARSAAVGLACARKGPRRGSRLPAPVECSAARRAAPYPAPASGPRPPERRRRRRWRRRRRSFRAGARPRPRVPSAPRRSRRSPLATSVAASPPGSTLGLAGRAERAGGRAGVGASRRRSPRGGAESGRRSSFRCRPVGRPAARPRQVPARASAKAGGGVRRRQGPEGKGVRRAPLRGKARARGWPSGGRAVGPSVAPRPVPLGGAGSGGRVGRGGGGGVAAEDAGVGAGRSEARRRGGRAAVSAGPGRAGRLGRTRSEPGSSGARAPARRPLESLSASPSLPFACVRTVSGGDAGARRGRGSPCRRSSRGRVPSSSLGGRRRRGEGGRSFRVVRRSGGAARSRKRPRKGSARSGPGPPPRARGGAEKADNS